MQIEDLKDKLTAIESICEYIHGSGINYDWKFTINKNYICCKNAFHCMDENGYYDGIQDFTIKFPITEKLYDFKLIFNGNQYYAKKFQLREYLEDTIMYGIDYYNGVK